MDLETAADELYGGSPDDFVERRTAWVAAARAAKDRPLARQIAALRRPTRTAWLLNLLARRSATAVAELFDLGLALQDAQRRLAGTELRRLSGERRRMVDRLAREAVRLGAEHGYSAPEAALQEVSQSLQAALADPAVGDQLRAGRLATAVTYGGFGPADLTAALAASMAGAAAPAPEPASQPEPAPEPESAAQPEPTPEPGPEPEPVGPEVEGSEVEGPDVEEQRRRAAQLEAAEAGWEAARAALDEAESAADEATAHADELAERIEELRTELERTEAEEVTARETARLARRAHQEARRAATAAEQARDAARTALGEGG